ncbi:MAG: hypothetical protein KGJ89_03285 [Patescibacteria group bacterium]|nr:hypothetical protein [Patescibacteria group bacterium]MDE2015431.1 hypothetical protein [Patescibacteria group bacterium]MDE2226954.1 hypothetical protein [Patescibacteria group bacterium]
MERGIRNTIREIVLRFRAKDIGFKRIKSGLKTVETRAATKKYRDFKAGDKLIFVCGNERFGRKITKVQHFGGIAAMLKKVPYKKINPLFISLAAAKKIYYGYPGYKEKIKKFGIIALYI